MNIIIGAKSIIWNVFELDVEKSKVGSNKLKFEYLDGYRGSLALIVAVSHFLSAPTCEILNLTIGYSLTYSVAGFFMLSAFLLTYRLLEDLDRVDFNNNSSSYGLMFLHICKYSIRRFFRIYLVYFLFVLALKIGPSWLSAHEQLTYESSFWQMITLGSAGFNHLWTIPSEIRYYFFIPLFCLVVINLKQHRVYILAVCVAWTIYDQLFNFFDLTADQIKFDYKDSHKLYPHFAVFFMGTEVALAYHIITKNESIMEWIRRPRVQLALDVVSLVIVIWGMAKNWWLLPDKSDFAYRSRATLYWSSALFLTLLGEVPNTIGSFFASSRILKSIGKYSFSFYLLHMSIGVALRKLPFKDQLGLVSAGLFTTYIVSFITFYLVENQLIRLANHLCARLENYVTTKTQSINIQLNNESNVDTVKLIV